MALRKPLFSVDDLAHTPDDGKRYEIMDGELIVSPAPTFEHQSVVTRFAAYLLRAEDEDYGRAVVAPVDVIFGRYRTAQPDLPFVRRERLSIIVRGKVRGVPDLVVEVLSPGTRRADLGWKMTLYAREGVPYYWVADPVARTVQPYRLGEEGYVAEPPLSGGDILACPLFPGITVEVARLFP